MARKPKGTEAEPKSKAKTRAKAAEPTVEAPSEAVETTPIEAVPEAPRGSKTAAVKAALKAHPKKQPKEIAAILQADGWDIKAQLVSVVKSGIKAKKKGPKRAVAAEETTTSSVPGDAVSLAALQKAKKLIQELGGIKEARSALNALSQLLD